jgi:gluconate 2-dehydrogenase gamma chain
MLLSVTAAQARVVKGELPFDATSDYTPEQVTEGSWRFFSLQESRIVEAIVDRIIPPDPDTPGGKDAGCAVFIDRQLAGPYGRSGGHYIAGPYAKGEPQQGDQSPLTPAERYRLGLAALDRYTKKAHGGANFFDLNDGQKDQILSALEKGSISLEGIDAKVFFKLILLDAQTGFFADPVYGGNRNLVAWKMIGFPGARYDYRDWVDRHNEPYPLPPIGINDHPDWEG